MNPKAIIPEIESAMRDFIKKVMEAIMRAERDVFIEEHGGTKNGYYTRNLDGLFGRMEFKAPRDREGM